MLKIEAIFGRTAAIQMGRFLTALALFASALGFLLVLYQGCTAHKMRVTSLKALKIVKLEERLVSARRSAGGRVEGNLERERLLNLEKRVLDELGLQDDEGPRRHSFLV
ncbi:MAG: hypothetical protein KVP17_002663 [Porospora cf. gigantea B]|nr:MAG: hypothetical protein KVP17_002663 [Porospora cf. gigantea B]